MFSSFWTSFVKVHLSPSTHQVYHIIFFLSNHTSYITTTIFKHNRWQLFLIIFSYFHIFIWFLLKQLMTQKCHKLFHYHFTFNITINSTHLVLANTHSKSYPPHSTYNTIFTSIKVKTRIALHYLWIISYNCSKPVSLLVVTPINLLLNRSK